MATSTVWVAGQYGTALDFDGSDDHIAISDSTSLRPQDITITAWVNPDTFSFATIIAKRRAGNNPSYAIDTISGGQWRFVMIPAAEESILVTTASAISTGEWTFIAATWDGSTMRAYKNGIVDPTTESHTAVSGYAAFDVLIGANDQSGTLTNFFDGRIDDVRIYNYARTAEEIRVDYNAGLSTHFR